MILKWAKSSLARFKEVWRRKRVAKVWKRQRIELDERGDDSF